jgi:hypothetical protein
LIHHFAPLTASRSPSHPATAPELLGKNPMLVALIGYGTFYARIVLVSQVGSSTPTLISPDLPSILQYIHQSGHGLLLEAHLHGVKYASSRRRHWGIYGPAGLDLGANMATVSSDIISQKPQDTRTAAQHLKTDKEKNLKIHSSKQVERKKSAKYHMRR